MYHAFKRSLVYFFLWRFFHLWWPRPGLWQVRRGGASGQPEVTSVLRVDPASWLPQRFRRSSPDDVSHPRSTALYSVQTEADGGFTHTKRSNDDGHHHHHHHHHQHIFVYYRSCHTQLSHRPTYYDNCTLLWQHTDINLTVTFVENKYPVSYLNVIETNVNRHLYTTISAQ